MKAITALLVFLVMVVALQLSTLWSSGHEDRSGKKDKIRVLIVDGFSNHDWKKTTDLIRGILDKTGLFEIDVSTAPPTAAAPGWDKWRPKFDAYDVVLQNCNDIGGGPSWPKGRVTVAQALDNVPARLNIHPDG